MIHEEKCYCAYCDNCGELFDDGDFNLFLLRSDLEDKMQNETEWYTGTTDPDHQGKHYCTNCYKQHPELDDIIIVDESRKKPAPVPKEN
jgi:hypothetical protein